MFWYNFPIFFTIFTQKTSYYPPLMIRPSLSNVYREKGSLLDFFKIDMLLFKVPLRPEFFTDSHQPNGSQQKKHNAFRKCSCHIDPFSRKKVTRAWRQDLARSTYRDTRLPRSHNGFPAHKVTGSFELRHCQLTNRTFPHPTTFSTTLHTFICRTNVLFPAKSMLFVSKSPIIHKLFTAATSSCARVETTIIYYSVLVLCTSKQKCICNQFNTDIFQSFRKKWDSWLWYVRNNIQLINLYHKNIYRPILVML